MTLKIGIDLQRIMRKLNVLQRPYASKWTPRAVALLPRRNSGGAATALPWFVHPQARIGTAYRAEHW
ncbi:hypothetical protein [Mesorhizobium temperatum]|uniref:hypothetical protein n=1 Tax=Mesorhizobium temperatum TaxID=241416 RepID=UPI00117CB026|nr:hypothetical protein [Mesorhizobium temperatum]